MRHMPDRHFVLAVAGLVALLVGPFIIVGALMSWWIPVGFAAIAVGSAPFMWVHHRLSEMDEARQHAWQGNLRGCFLLVLIALALPGWTDDARVWTILGLIAAVLFFETAWVADESERGTDE